MHFSSRLARVLLLLLVLGAPVTATLAFERAAGSGAQLRPKASVRGSAAASRAGAPERIKEIEAPK